MHEVACPICKTIEDERRLVLSLDCGNFDGSTLYPRVTLVECGMCHHLFNLLSTAEEKGISDYYANEYAPTNVASGDKHSDLPGTVNSFSVKRYEYLYDLIHEYIPMNGRIVDIGCAAGGFLQYVNSVNRYVRTLGVEPTRTYVKTATDRGIIAIQGTAEETGLLGDYADVIIMDQVLEHVTDLGKVFAEARRVLRKDGILCVSVPDAARYVDHQFFDFYWFLLREHVQHFDMSRLELLGSLEGFDHVKMSLSVTPMMGDTMTLPNLTMIFKRRTERKDHDTIFVRRIADGVEEYIGSQFDLLARRRSELSSIGSRPVYAWGIGREFLYLLENGAFGEMLPVMIDSNAYKQKHNTVRGQRIIDPSDSTVEIGNPSATVVITASAHEGSIRGWLHDMGFVGTVIALSNSQQQYHNIKGR